MLSILIGKSNGKKLSNIKKRLVLNRLSKAIKNCGINVVKADTDVDELIWTRDIYFPIDDKYIICNLSRKTYSNGKIIDEYKEIKSNLIAYYPNIQHIKPPKNVKLEGGDVVRYSNEIIFVGIGRRTNKLGYKFIKKTFKNKIVIPIKHSALHLDSVFCVLDNGIIFYDGKYIKDVIKIPNKIKSDFKVYNIEYLVDSGKYLATNFLKIGKDIIISNTPENETFREILRKLGYKLHVINTEGIWHEGGSVHCLTQWL